MPASVARAALREPADVVSRKSTYDRTVVTNALIIGVGGLGCPASLALARAGISRMTLVDADTVDLTNLHRQPLHHDADLGRPKVRSAAEKLRAQFPPLALTLMQDKVTAANAEALFRAHDVVLDCTDGVHTKFLLSDAAVLTGTPLVYAGVLRFEGLAMRIERGGPCLRCLFETPPDDAPTCAQAGVLGSMAGLMGGLQAELALKPSPTAGVSLLQVIDGHSFSFRSVKVKKRADCAACGSDAKPVLRDEWSSTSPETCAR